MKFYTRRRASPVITIVSLIDILTILLIFFIVTTTFKSAQPQVQISLPSIKTAVAKTNPTKPAILSIDRTGAVYLDEKAVSFEELGDAAKKVAAAGKPMALKADKEAPAGRLFEVLDALQSAGLKELPAFTQQKK